MKHAYMILFFVVSTLSRLDSSHAQQGNNNQVWTELFDEDAGNDDVLAGLLSDLGVEGSDLTCLQETNNFAATSPALVEASMAWRASMNARDGIQSITYGADEIQALQTACDTANGLFLIMSHQTFQCTPQADFAKESMGEDLAKLENDTFPVTVENMASCHADTPSCRDFDPETMLKSMWAGLGLDCAPVVVEGDKKGNVNSNNNNKDGDLPPTGLLFLAVIAVGGFLYGAVFIVRRSQSRRETVSGDGNDDTGPESENQDIV